jgi:hypothetical protein
MSSLDMLKKITSFFDCEIRKPGEGRKLVFKSELSELIESPNQSFSIVFDWWFC